MLLSLVKTKPWSQITRTSFLKCSICKNVNVWGTNERDEPLCEGCATMDWGIGLQTYYSKQLLSRLIPALGNDNICQGCLNEGWATDEDGKVWCEECANQCK